MFVDIPFLDDIIQGKNDNTKKQPLDDCVDRLHYYVTVYVLCIFAILVGSKQHFGNPIDCFIPADADKVKTWQAYILDYCFMQGTYRYELNFASSSREFRSNIDAPHVPVKYYQWVPFFFAFQLLCFMMPNFFWVWVQSYLYLDMSVIVTETAELNKKCKACDRTSKIDKIVDYIFGYFYYRKIAKRGCFSSTFHQPAVASVLYTFTKLLYLSNTVFQFYLVNHFLGFPDVQWSLRMMLAIISGDRQTSTHGIATTNHGDMAYFPFFPLEVGCNYTRIESNNNVHKSTIQCMIPLNYINEKLFLFLWFWIVVLTVVTVFSVLLFIGSIMSRTQREYSILSLLKDKDDELAVKDKSNIALKFVHGFLGADGVLLTRFISSKAGTMTCQDVLLKVFSRYCREKGVSMNDSWAVPSDGSYSGSYYINGEAA